mgnify:CR=1 FL=1
MKPAEPFDTLPGPVQETINAHAKYYAKHHNLGMSIRDDMTYVAKVALRWRSALPAESAPLTEEAASRCVVVPLEPTEAMLKAGIKFLHIDEHTPSLRGAYRAMLAVAQSSSERDGE